MCIFGSPGFLAAYNAGPGRLDEYVNGHVPLPQETQTYLAMIAPRIEGDYPGGSTADEEVAMNTPPASGAAIAARSGDGPAAERVHRPGRGAGPGVKRAFPAPPVQMAALASGTSSSPPSMCPAVMRASRPTAGASAAASFYA